MKIEVRNGMAEEKLHAFVVGFFIAALDHNLLVFGTVDLLRR